MNKYFLKSFFIFVFTMSAYAEETAKPCKEKCEISCIEDPPPSNCGYNCPSRIDVKGVWDYYASATFLYVQPKENGLAFAMLFNFDQSGLEKSSLNDFDYDFFPAFKAGVGISSDSDGWNLFAEYTRIYSSTSKRKKFDPSFFGTVAGKKYFSPVWIFSNLEPTEGIVSSYEVKADWKLRFNIVDLTLGRSYFAGRQLLLHPYFGLRGGLINQKVDSESKSINNLSLFYIMNSKNHSQSWLIGPRFGVDTSWLLGKGFRLYGNAGASLFFDHLKLSKDDDIVPLNPLAMSRFLSHLKKKTVTSNLDASIGFGWGSYFNDRNWHLDFSLGYDFQIFFEQNYLQYLNLLSNSTEEFYPHSLVFHGLNMKLQIDF